MDPSPTGNEHPEPEGAPARQPFFNIAPAVLALIALNAVVHALRVWMLDPEADFDLLVETAFIPARYTIDEVGFSASWLTSPVTYGYLHGDLAHLGLNMIWLAIFGSPLAARIGAARFLFFFNGAIVAGAAAHFAAYPGSVAFLVGASGGVSGVTGAAARYAFRVSRADGVRDFSGPLLPVTVALRIPMVVAFCAVWLGVNFLSGAGLLVPEGSGEVAWIAHVGGFVFGFFLIGFLDRRPR